MTRILESEQPRQQPLCSLETSHLEKFVLWRHPSNDTVQGFIAIGVAIMGNLLQLQQAQVILQQFPQLRMQLTVAISGPVEFSRLLSFLVSLQFALTERATVIM